MLRRNELVGAVKDILYEQYDYGRESEHNLEVAKEIVETILRMQQK